MCHEVVHDYDCDPNLDLDELFRSKVRVPCLEPRKITLRGKQIFVPCGKCWICEKKRKLAWTNRLMIELDHSRSSYFITLTYADEYVPVYEDSSLSSNGKIEHVKFNCLQKEDVQKFLKRLRKQYDCKLRYFLVGEYGPLTYRPHYHLILFFDQVVDYWDLYYKLEKCWPLGYFKMRVTDEKNAQYTAKYCISIPNLPDYYKFAPQFMCCSKGIGRDFLTNKTINYYKQLLYGQNETKQANLLTRDGYQYALPRYFKDRIFSKFEKNQMCAQANNIRNREREIEQLLYQYLIDYERRNENCDTRYLQYYQNVTAFLRNLAATGEKWKNRNVKSKKL